MQEYERAVIFRLGRLLHGGSRGPGNWTSFSHQKRLQSSGCCCWRLCLPAAVFCICSQKAQILTLFSPYLPARYLLCSPLYRVISKSGLAYHYLGSASSRSPDPGLRHRVCRRCRLLPSEQCHSLSGQCGERPSLNEAVGPNHVAEHPGYQKPS